MPEIVVRLTYYLATGFAMFNGEMPHSGAAACSWNFPIGTRLVLPAGDVVTCKDRGMLGSRGHVDVWVHDHVEGRRLIAFYGTTTTVRILETP
jgi:3D (Asp-Asp-Asp) domain-containing protein